MTGAAHVACEPVRGLIRGGGWTLHFYRALVCSCGATVPLWRYSWHRIWRSLCAFRY